MIIGDHIRLRSPEREDLPRFVKWLNDPEVRQGLSLYLPLSLINEEKWFENMLTRPQSEHILVIEIQKEDSDQVWIPIGNCGFHEIDWRNRSSEFGIFIGEKSLWNQGFGTAAICLLVQHGFNNLNLNRIYLRVFDNNQRAIRAYEKAGFMHEGRLRQAEYQDGHYIDVLVMSILRQEWSGASR